MFVLDINLVFFIPSLSISPTYLSPLPYFSLFSISLINLSLSLFHHLPYFISSTSLTLSLSPSLSLLQPLPLSLLRQNIFFSWENLSLIERSVVKSSLYISFTLSLFPFLSHYFSLSPFLSPSFSLFPFCLLTPLSFSSRQVRFFWHSYCICTL